jgi:hypothetical protein
MIYFWVYLSFTIIKIIIKIIKSLMNLHLIFMFLQSNFILLYSIALFKIKSRFRIYIFYIYSFNYLNIAISIIIYIDIFSYISSKISFLPFIILLLYYLMLNSLVVFHFSYNYDLSKLWLLSAILMYTILN